MYLHLSLQQILGQLKAVTWRVCREKAVRLRPVVGLVFLIDTCSKVEVQVKSSHNTCKNARAAQPSQLKDQSPRTLNLSRDTQNDGRDETVTLINLLVRACK
jgi:hypothetical protein